MKIKLFKFKSVKSTNDVALKLIKNNSTKPALIFSHKQSKGRGTMGKKWISTKGNLFISIFFRINSKKINFGDELDAAQAEAKAWKTIWSAGQGVTSIEDCPSTKDLIDKLKKEFIDSIKNQVKVLEKFS